MFEKHLVVLASIEEGDDPSTVSLNYAEFHILVIGLPISRMHKAMVAVGMDTEDHFFQTSQPLYS